jgi:hypothetical protein
MPRAITEIPSPHMRVAVAVELGRRGDVGRSAAVDHRNIRGARRQGGAASRPPVGSATALLQFAHLQW